MWSTFTLVPSPPVSRQAGRSFTTVRQDFVALGHQAFKLLLASIGHTSSPHSVRMTPGLVVRASTGPVRRSAS